MVAVVAGWLPLLVWPRAVVLRLVLLGFGCVSILLGGFLLVLPVCEAGGVVLLLGILHRIVQCNIDSTVQWSGL